MLKKDKKDKKDRANIHDSADIGITQSKWNITLIRKTEN